MSYSATFLPVRSTDAPQINQTSPMAQQVAGSILSSYRGHLTSVRSLSWSSDSMRIVSAGNDKTVHVWDAATGNSHHLFQDETGAARIVAWSSDGTRIATVGVDAVARVRDVATNRLIASYPEHRGHTVNAMTWSPNGKYIASRGGDTNIQVWVAP